MKKQDPLPPKGRPRSFDPEAALDCAMRVFWKKGYLGTSLSDLTEAMGINRPSLYAAFGNKESLFRKALHRYNDGPARYLQEALREPTARQVGEHLLRGAVEIGTDLKNPRGCLWLHGVLSCGDTADRAREDMATRRLTGEAELKKRFKRAIAERDLPEDTDPAALARWVMTLNFGLSVQAALGASRAELLRVVDVAMRAWPAGK